MAPLGESSIVFDSWGLGNDGQIHPSGAHSYPIGAYFVSRDVDSIDYEWSDDGANWYPVVPEMIVDDSGVGHYEDYGVYYWYRDLLLDLTSWPEGTYYFRATAANSSGQYCLSEVAEVHKESVFFRFGNWWLSGPIDMINGHRYGVGAYFFSSTDIESIDFEWSGDGTNWNPVASEMIVYDSEVVYYDDGVRSYWYRDVELDLTSWSDGTYYFRATATNRDGQQCLSEVAETLKESVYIRLTQWGLGTPGLINIENAGSFYVNVEFESWADIDSIEFEVSSDGANWNPMDPETIQSDTGVKKWSIVWYRALEIDTTSWPEGTNYLKVTATDVDGRFSSEETEVYKDTVPPEDVTDFTVEPNAEGDALVLTWTNPEDFEFVRVQKGDGYWQTLVETTGNSYIDKNVWPGDRYQYRIVVFDSAGNQSPDPATVTAGLPVPPIRLLGWYTQQLINSENHDSFWISTEFEAQADLLSINYYLSADGSTWEEISQYPGVSIVYDSGLESHWDSCWYRAVNVNLSDLADGSYWLKAAAEDVDGLTLDDVLELTKDTVVADAENFTITPNEDNDALALTWTIPDPDDFYYANVYKYNSQRGRWDYVTTIEADTYVDRDIDSSNLYLYHRYRVVLVDKAFNESQNPPEASGKLHSESLIAVSGWNVTNEGKINSTYAQGVDIRVYFFSSNPVADVDFTYKTAADDWKRFWPFVRDNYSLSYDAATASGSKRITADISGPLGIPDGEILLRVAITDTAGNTLTEEYQLVKDTVRPKGVSGFTVNLSDDGTALVLSWVNPTEDFSHVVIRRDSTVLSSQFTGESFIDTTALPGIYYTYRVIVVDALGNQDPNAATVTAVLPTTEGPVLVSMSPEDGFLTRANSVSYEAVFRCDITVLNILLEVSLDGEVWEVLTPLTTGPSYYGGNYWVEGTWDVRSIGEEEYLIRARAVDAAGRSTTTDARTIRIDHIGPVAPADFAATIDPDSHSVTLSWSPLEEAVRYALKRYPANPDDGYVESWDIDPPEHAFVDSKLESETLYIYSLMAYDSAGNAGDSTTLTAEIYEGPALTLQGGLDIYTNVSQYTLRGVTEPGATVTVNGSVVDIGPDGEFSYSTELQLGEQVFTVVASLAGAQHTQKQRVVLDTTAPSVSYSTAPYDGSTIRGTVTLRFALSDGVAGGAFQVGRDDGETWEDVLPIPLSSQDISWDTTAPVGELGPLADGSYKFRATVWDRAGNFGFSQIRIWTIKNTPPQAPRDVTAVGEVDTIRVSWLANVEPVSEYKVYRSILPGGPYALVGTVFSYDPEPTSYVDTTVDSRTPYYYVVTATPNQRESAFSQEVSAVPQDDTTPPVVTDVPFWEGNVYGRGTLSFDSDAFLRATDNSHRGIREFIFEFSCDGGATWETIVCPEKPVTTGDRYYTTTDKIWTPDQTKDLQPGHYTLRFRAVDQSGNTSEPHPRNIIIGDDPTPPQNLTVTRGEGSLILTWDPVEEDGFQYYTVHRSTYITGGYQELKLINQRENTTYTDTDVQMGKTYCYKVVHQNIRGASESAVASGTPSDDLMPPVVTYLDPLEVYFGGPEARFEARATDNKAVSTMKAYYSLDGGHTWENMNYLINLSTTAGAATAHFTWLTAGLPKDPALNVGVRVVAIDQAGNESAPLQAFWTLDLWVNPAANLRTTPGDGSILLEWDPSPDTDLSLETYRILRSTVSGGPYLDPAGAPVYTSGTYYYDHTALPNTVYYYVVETKDFAGNVARSEEVAGSASLDTLPPYIVPEHGVTIGGDRDVFLFVYFEDNAGPEGCRATIKYKDAEGNWVQIGPVLTNPHKVQGTDYYDLNTGWNLRYIETGNYVVRYTVYDASDNASQIEVTYHVDRAAPGAPANLTAMYGLGQIGLSWEAPSDGDVKEYRVYRANEIAGPYQHIDTVEGRENVLYSDATVQPGLTYFYYVTAVDQFYQEGPKSNTTAAKAELDESPPQILGIDPGHGAAIGPKTPITVTAADNIFVVSITLEYSLDGENWYEITTKTTQGEAVFYWADASTLNCDGPVKIRAIARDSSNNESDRDAFSAVRDYILDTVGPDVTGLSYVVSANEALLYWDLVTSPDFSHVLIEGVCYEVPGGYRYEETVSGKQCLVTGLYPGYDYRYKVTAYDRLGNPGVTAEVIVSTQVDVSPPHFAVPPKHSLRNYQGTLKLYQAARHDESGVHTFTFEYSTDGSLYPHRRRLSHLNLLLFPVHVLDLLDSLFATGSRSIIPQTAWALPGLLLLLESTGSSPTSRITNLSPSTLRAYPVITTQDEAFVVAGMKGEVDAYLIKFEAAPFVQDAEALSDGIRLSFSETVQRGPDLRDVSLLVGGEAAEFCMEISFAVTQTWEGNYVIEIHIIFRGWIPLQCHVP